MAGGVYAAPPAKKAPPDPIENLITEEQKEIETWMDEGEENLPPVFLLGDEKGVRLYADFMETAPYEKLCGSIEIEELLAATQGSADEKEVSVNLGINKVRALLGESCLARPKDVLLAVGQGWVKPVELGDFQLRSSQPVCPFDASYALWSQLKEPLPSTPLFFTSSFQDPKESAAAFIEPLSVSTISISQDEKSWIGSAVEFLSEYSIEAYDLNAVNCDRIYHLKKSVVKLADVGNPGEMLVWRKGENVGILEMEIIDNLEGSGSVHWDGAFDFNQDGLVELWISGVQKGCVYHRLFLGLDFGFQPVLLPEKPCAC